MVNILIADNHITQQNLFQRIIERRIPNSVIEHAGSEDIAVEKIKGKTYHIIVISFDLAGPGTAALVTRILAHRPKAGILIFGMKDDDHLARKFLSIGAMACLDKGKNEAEITKAIDNILESKMYISPSLLERLALDVVKDRKNNPFRQLSQREFEIVRLLLSGGSPGEISTKLRLHPSTVATYKSRIMEKLNCKDLSEAASLALTYHIAI